MARNEFCWFLYILDYCADTSWRKTYYPITLFSPEEGKIILQGFLSYFIYKKRVKFGDYNSTLKKNVGTFLGPSNCIYPALHQFIFYITSCVSAWSRGHYSSTFLSVSVRGIKRVKEACLLRDFSVSMYCAFDSWNVIELHEEFVTFTESNKNH